MNETTLYQKRSGKAQRLFGVWSEDKESPHKGKIKKNSLDFRIQKKLKWTGRKVGTESKRLRQVSQATQVPQDASFIYK